MQFYLQPFSIQDASVWMDEKRSDRSFDFMKPWHYVDFPKGEIYQPSKEENIINELNSVIAELKNRKNLSKGDITINLKILIHLIGDLHQPLHTGYAIDKGGNSVDVIFMESESNLHKVWDSGIIKSKSITTEVCEKAISNFSKTELEEKMKIDFVEWMNQSRTHLDAVYNMAREKIGQDYLDRTAPIVETQLLLAGLRITSLLQEVFK